MKKFEILVKKFTLRLRKLRFVCLVFAWEINVGFCFRVFLGYMEVLNRFYFVYIMELVNIVGTIVGRDFICDNVLRDVV